MLRKIKIRNLLSFNDDTDYLELEPLNILIGPNGSGKSNLIESINILKALPRDISIPIREGGSTIKDWIWKGAQKNAIASLEVIMDLPKSRHNIPIRYYLDFRESINQIEVVDERIENEYSMTSHTTKPYFYFGYEDGRPTLNIATGEYRNLERANINEQQSILSQRKDPEQYPEVSYVGELFDAIKVYRDWRFGRYTPARVAQPADLPNIYLMEDFTNLGLVLNRLRKKTTVKKRLLEELREICPELTDVDVSIEAGTVQVFFQEGDWTIPATRLSDGLLRWLCLLCILLNPDPPPVVCIEEPEIGLHPDMIDRMAGLLKEASKNTQLIVTTHSDILVDSFSDTPRAIVTCDKVGGSTEFNRLQETEQLREWLKNYTLGRLWRTGEIGGTRW